MQDAAAADDARWSHAVYPRKVDDDPLALLLLPFL